MMDIARNRDEWRVLAREGDPIRAIEAARFAEPLAGDLRETFVAIPEPGAKPEWRFVPPANNAWALAFSAADEQSPHHGREDLISAAIEAVDAVLAQIGPNGCWTCRGEDPNADRFTLYRLMETARLLSDLSECEDALARWTDPLRLALDHQHAGFHERETAIVEADYGVRYARNYPNIDLLYALSMTLAGQVFGEAKYTDSGRELVRAVGGKLLPDGGFSYIYDTNEAPVYHTLHVCLISRYHDLTGDEFAGQVLEQTAPYYPLTLSEEATPEMWSAPWWKQNWQRFHDRPISPAPVMITADHTGDARNRWLMWRALERIDPTQLRGSAQCGFPWLCAVGHWPDEDGGEALAEDYFTSDDNIRGQRARRGRHYWGCTQGRGQRTTYVGGMATDPDSGHVLAALRGVQVHAVVDGDERWMSGIDDITATDASEDVAALGVRARLHAPLYANTDDLGPSPCAVTQTWRLTRMGLAGLVAIDATKPCEALTLRIALGPAELEREEDGLWRCGPLRIAVYDAFSEPAAGGWANPGDETRWPALEITLRALEAVPGQVSCGLWIGPEDAEAPTEIAPLDGAEGFVAQGADGAAVGALFAPEEPVSVEIAGETVSADAGECVLIRG
jgi:hypothetical protein